MHEAICSRNAASRQTQSASHRYSNKRGTQIFNFPRKREGRMDQEKNFFLPAIAKLDKTLLFSAEILTRHVFRNMKAKWLKENPDCLFWKAQSQDGFG